MRRTPCRCVLSESAADSTEKQVCTQSVVPTRGGDMSPPYSEAFRNHSSAALSFVKAHVWTVLFTLLAAGV